jgi:GT2 family glycosyltransferase
MAGIGPMPIAAIVLNYRTPEDSVRAVRSLLALRRPLPEIIVVDNDSAGRCLHAFGEVAGAVTYLSTGRNLGFSGGMNVGIVEALGRGARAVLLVNSDVVVTPDCVQELERCLDAEPAAAIAGPIVLAALDPRVVTSRGMSYRRSSGRMRLLGHGTSIATLDSLPSAVVDGVSGCLMLVKREVFETIGLLDERFFFSFEDLDFCLRARRAGFLTVVAGRAAAYHEGSRSIGPGSPRKLYFAARNHLLMARLAAPAAPPLAAGARNVLIVIWNLAHALVAGGSPLPGRLAAVARGTFDYLAGRFGPDLSASNSPAKRSAGVRPS